MRKTILIFLMLTVGLVVFFMNASSPNDFEFDDTVKSNTGAIKQYSLGDTLKVITYNIGYLSGMTNNLPMKRPKEFVKRNETRLKSFLQVSNPDIIGFQEIDFQSKRSYGNNQAAMVIEEMNYAANYLSINWNKRYVPFPYWPVEAHFGQIVSGQAVLSRFQLTTPQTLVLERPESDGFLFSSFYLDRLLQVVDVCIGKDTLKLMNVHLEAFDKPTRVRQAEVVKQEFLKYSSKMPVLLIGDFNSKAKFLDSSDAMNIILSTTSARSAISEEQYLRDPKSYFTFNTDEPYQMIDFIIYNPSFINLISADVLQNTGQISDHFPLKMEFVLIDQNAVN